MATDVAVVRAVDAFNTRTAIVRKQVTDYIARRWGTMPSAHRPDIEQFVRQIVPVIEAGQLQIAALTDSYLAAVEVATFGRTARPVGVPRDVVNDLAMRGTPTADVYSRTGVEVWRSLDAGLDLNAALSAGLDRALRTSLTDLQLAHTHSARYVAQANPAIVGHRRVLVGDKSCRLCVSASLQKYGRDDLQPIHGRCDCKVMPIFEGGDPGRTLNRELLDELKSSGIAGDLQLTQAVRRQRLAMQAAEDRIDELRGELAQAEPAQRQRIEAQIADAERARSKAEKAMQRQRDQLDDYRGVNGRPKTVIVHDHGEIGPVLADREHRFLTAVDVAADS